MYDRCRGVGTTFWLAVVGVLVCCGNAQAHRLRAECHVLPGNRVQVESWYDGTRAVPEGADVYVYRYNGDLLTQGKLDAHGMYVFSFSQAERLQVVVSAGDGHAAKLWLTEQDLRAGQQTAQGRDAGDAPLPSSVREAEFPFKDLLYGVGFLLAAAAFVLSWRNARRLQALEQQARLTSTPAPLPPAAPPTDPDRR